MDYKNIFLSTLQLFRKSKLVWIFGSLAIINEIIYRASKYSIAQHPSYYALYLLVVVTLYFSFLTECGLIYSANQILSNHNPTFSEVWAFCKSKARTLIAFYFYSFPIILFIVFIVELFRASQISVSLTIFIGMFGTFFLNSLVTIFICTVALNNLNALFAFWTGFSIVLNNFFHIIVLNCIFLIIQIFLTWSTKNTLFGIFLNVPLTVTIMLAYKEFITKNSYPTLSNAQPTA